MLIILHGNASNFFIDCASLFTSTGLTTNYVCRAAWHGTRIILEQVSPEANAIYDFILELHKSCKGQWAELGSASSLQQSEIDAFVRYSVTFLSNIGNFYVSIPPHFFCKWS